MEKVKCCRNCENSLWAGTPDDPNREHLCHVVTSGRIKNETKCKDFGHKHFSPKETEDKD